ncbi:MAG: hypothetical protein ACR2HS_01015 [Gammaproteobacteria bacterium]
MKSILAIISMISFFAALIVFFQSMQNAFKKSFTWGIIFLLFFPIGNFFYYKKFISEEKKSAISFLVTLSVGTLTFLMAKVI